MRLARLSILLSLTLGALLLASDAAPGASLPTELVVTAASTSPGATTEHELDLTLAAGAAATQKLATYVPAGYTANLAAAPGTKLGGAVLEFRSSSASSSSGGNLTADDPAKYVANACVPGTHAAVWLAPATVGSQATTIPIYVDPVTPDLATRAAYVLQACFGPPGTSGRHLTSLSLDVTRVFTNPRTRGTYIWRTIVTPYGPGDVVNVTGAVEAQALLPLPYRLTVKTRYDRKRRRVSFSGAVTAGTSVDARSPVQILVVTKSGLKAFGTAKTDARGRFAFTKALKQTTRFELVAGFALFSDCDPTLEPAPCASETLSPSEARVLTVNVPKR